jgi:hypothetical protein
MHHASQVAYTMSIEVITRDDLLPGTPARCSKHAMGMTQTIKFRAIRAVRGGERCRVERARERHEGPRRQIERTAREAVRRCEDGPRWWRVDRKRKLHVTVHLAEADKAGANSNIQ